MIGKKINQLATELAPESTDLTIIGDPTTGVSKKITLAQLGAIFSGAVSFYNDLASFPATGDINVIYCAKDTQKLYLWTGSAYVEVFPSQALLDTYQLRSEKGNANGYASLDSQGKVPISQLPSSIMEYKGTWNAATNTPTLANGTGDTGDVYICNVAGTVNFGAGPITFAVGDYVIYSGTIWQRSSGAVGTVTSVAASITGDSVTISGSPVTTSGTLAFAFAGTGAQYIKGDGTLATFPSTIAQAERLITEVYNSTGATLTKGTVVYINGGQGNLPTVTKAIATGDSTSAQTFGIVQADITNNNNGFVVIAGKITDIDTQAYTEGTQLYLSSTTAGAYTSTKQYAPNHLVYVGIIVRSHPTQGVIEVKIQNGYELDELHDVAAQSPSNGDILQYVSSTSLWTKVAGTTSNIAEGSNLYYTDARSRAAISLTTTGTSGAATYNSTTGVLNVPQYAPDLSGYVPTSRTLTINGTAFDLSANRSWSVGTVTSVGLSSATSGVTIGSTPITTSGTITLAIATASGSQQGLLSSTDWTTFNNKQNALTNPITGTGTTNYLPKFTGASTIGDSIVFDNGTNVGIGTANPTQKLSVSAAAALMDITSTTGTNFNGLELKNSGGSFYVGQDNSTGGFYGSGLAYAASLYVSGNNPIVFFTNGTSKMTLSASGNLGLGVTPSAWSGFKVLQVGSLSSLYSSPSTYLGHNVYYNSGNKYIGNGYSLLYGLNDSGQFVWYNASSGTAGNAITFTQAMTLNASGNLSIGNTNDTYKLDVSGIIYTQNQISGYLAGQSGLRTYTKSPQFVISSYQSVVGGGFTKTTDIVANADAGADSEIRFLTATTSGNPTTRLTIASTGAATFSSSVTASKLQVGSSLGLSSQLEVYSASYGNLAAFRSIPSDGINSYLLINTSADGVTLEENGSSYRSLIFKTGGSERMHITSGGNVVIGGTSEVGRLRIFSANTSSTGLNDLMDLTNAVNTGLRFQITGTSDGDQRAYIGTTTPSSFAFGTNSTERMRITSGGNVEISTGSIKTGTPSLGAAQPWKLGEAVSGTLTANYYIKVEINGQIYSIPALQGTP